MKGEYDLKKCVLSITMATILLTTTISVGSTVSAESIQEMEKKIKQHESEKSTITKEKNNLEGDKKDTESKISKNINEQNSVEQEIVGIEEELRNTQNEIATKESEIKSTNEEIEELNLRIEKLKEEIEILEDKIAKRDELLKDRLRSIQKSGGKMSYVEVVFGAKSFADFISRTTAVTTIMDQDKTIMQEQAADKKLLQENKKEVEDKKTIILAKKEELEGQKKDLVALKGQLDNQKSERKTLIAKLEKEHDELEEIKLTIQEEQEILAAEEKAQAQAIALAKQKIGELEQLAKEEAERKRKEEEQAREERSRAEQEEKSNNETVTAPTIVTPSEPVGGGGSGIFINPASGPLTSGYGMRVHPIFNYPKLHAGVDFAVGTGTTLVAPADGVVSTASSMGGFGNVIMISHYIDGKSYTTVSAHLSSINVSPGQVVSKGQAIGATGNTGNSTGPHLHFEVHLGGYGNPVNPMPYLN